MTWHKRDPIMAKLVKSLPVPIASTKDDLYLALLDSVIGQQLSVKAADSIFIRFCALFKDNYPDAKKLSRMSVDKLRGAGLSNAKVIYVKEVAKAHLKHPITMQRFSHLTDDEIIAELTSIKGVGTWTVQMLLMFPMNRPDIFSIGDLVIRQMMVEHYQLTETGKVLHERLHEIAEKWRPFRSLACKYLWNSRDAAKREKLMIKAKKV